jgi:hypothetical protein
METVEYLRFAENDPLPEVDSYAPFKAIIVSSTSASREWRDQVGAWLVSGGCMYAMAWGLDGEAWHDAVDSANIGAFKPERVPDHAHVMTTWHSDEPLDEVFWYAQFCAHQEYVEFAATLIIHISTAGARQEMLERFEAARELHG